MITQVQPEDIDDDQSAGTRHENGKVMTGFRKASATAQTDTTHPNRCEWQIAASLQDSLSTALLSTFCITAFKISTHSLVLLLDTSDARYTGHKQQHTQAPSGNALPKYHLTLE